MTTKRQKPYRQPTSKAGRIEEAKSAIGRLEHTLGQGDNRFGTYGDNVRASIKRWEATIASLTA